MVESNTQMELGLDRSIHNFGNTQLSAGGPGNVNVCV